MGKGGTDQKDFAPVKPIERLDGWRVEKTENGYVWYVVGPDDVTAARGLGIL